MLTRPTTTPIPSPEAQQKSIRQHQQKLRENLQQAAEERMRLRLDRLRRRHRYQHETLEQKVQRLVNDGGLEYDAIRRVVEQESPLDHPTPARIRERREAIARLINQYRQDVQNTQALTQAQSLKALYRQAAARLHPDRARDEAERQYRHQVMSRVNLAYRARDLQQLQTILHHHEPSG
jgi:hypothetical protein